ncbi:EamA family transporter [Planococcaceae bacterium Storch 2/2-2]|nr:EamA family transporter [Planococcaceae bacterium Storch 2/2-2]
MKPRLNPYAMLLVGVFSLALSAIFVKMSTSPSGVTAFYRMLLSVLFMTPFLMKVPKSEWFALRKRDVGLAAIAGSLLAFHFITWFESLRYTSVASSTVLVTLQPIFAFLGTYLFFKEKVGMRQITAAAIAILGSFIISWGDFRIGGEALYGDLLALAGCFFITLYLLIGQSVRSRVELFLYTYIVYAFSTVVLFGYAWLVDGTIQPSDSFDWVWFIALALIPNFLGHTILNWAVRYVSTNVISIAILLEPVGATIFAYFIFDERLIATQWVGGAVVIVGIALFALSEKRN